MHKTETVPPPHVSRITTHRIAGAFVDGTPNRFAGAHHPGGQPLCLDGGGVDFDPGGDPAAQLCPCRTDHGGCLRGAGGFAVAVE